MKKFMNNTQLTIAIILSAICALGIIARHLWPCIIIDETTLFLFALGTFPWLIVFFKKIKVPGFEAEFNDRAQSSTNNPIPPLTHTPTQQQSPSILSNDAKKILATLWRYQKQLFKDDISNRWTFAVFPSAPDFPKYLNGLSELVNKGLVAILPDSYQILLTNEGISFVNGNTELQNYSDIYLF